MRYKNWGEMLCKYTVAYIPEHADSTWLQHMHKVQFEDHYDNIIWN